MTDLRVFVLIFGVKKCACAIFLRFWQVWLRIINLSLNQGEWANVAITMVSIFIKQSHTINLEMDITKLQVRLSKHLKDNLGLSVRV